MFKVHELVNDDDDDEFGLEKRYKGWKTLKRFWRG